MAVVQVPLDIPPVIEAGLKTGKYIRAGGIIRDAKSKKIVKHLKEAGVAEQAKQAKHVVFDFIKEHKGGFIVGGLIITAVTTGGVYVYNKIKYKEFEMPEPLREYLNAANNGTMTEKEIKHLLKYLEGMDEEQLKDRISLSNKEVKEMIKQIYDYTQRLAEANHYNEELKKIKRKDDLAKVLYNCLLTQKNIYVKEQPDWKDELLSLFE